MALVNINNILHVLAVTGNKVDTMVTTGGDF